MVAWSSCDKNCRLLNDARFKRNRASNPTKRQNAKQERMGGDSNPRFYRAPLTQRLYL